MPFYVPIISVALVFAAAAGSAWAGRQDQVCPQRTAATEGTLNMGSPEEGRAIKKVIVEMSEGFNKHDAAAATRMYWPDADFVSVRGEMGIGRNRAEKGLRVYFQDKSEKLSRQERKTQHRKRKT